ncbi:HU family DNA-binding protein [Acidithiobacillus ferrooxidans]|uniref:HU family DNA-binding protein n=2 Tax=Acidithiobacillus ferrooxidans TaxID=920 RepID=A0A2W1K585_ACIFR|nr:HU family DNA-binding protein [Acidithiobacillus ferrooxidans]MBU2816125.1 HU family DNA-binding protein [Acidithiobacillus ferrooxidans]MCR1344184.1 HU family DNA-binding protein [Acidithiobacillus ferrooxidans]PZD81833.1 HU family DNA-binding protein [Acidithiobacillus ferrooxidans]QLK41875.1 HU family DNA-binding protein [Acidithiobacillus ferrooxidans]QZT53836.1 HU family DNA-binding protein [Acidithiobacillus ferrooxidans]
MKKGEFVAAMSAHGALTRKDAEHFLTVFADTLRDSLQREARIALPGIGVFTVQERAARTGRNPATGQEIQIPAKKAVKFKTAKEIADAVA